MHDEKIIDQLSDLISSFICYAGSHLPDDVDAKIKEMATVETEGFAPTIYKAMADNMDLANKLKRPSCQDTGIIQFFAKVGTGFPYQNELPEALEQAVLKATERAPLRHNAVQVF
ncbi:MAG: fumarate hydratase, partial [Clostridiales bacterium]|nr:fumarate hydratase [Clostridiales bacterium]